MDPIPEIAALAASAGANCHVDACMGGFVLPFVEMLGRDVPPWDFRVDGVSSISADIHKLGYAPKGVSVILHRTKELRALPDLRLRRLARRLLRVAEPAGHPIRPADGRGLGGHAAPRRRRLRRADPPDARRTPTRCARASGPSTGVTVLGDGRLPPDRHGGRHRRAPTRSTCSPSATPSSGGGGSTTARARPTTLHSTVSNSNIGVIDEYLPALQESVDEVRGTTAEDRSTNYATLE